MTELFRFVLMRPPDAPGPQGVKALGASFLSSPTTFEEARVAAAAALRDGRTTVPVGASLPYADLARAVVRLLERGPRPASDVVALVKNVERVDTIDAVTGADDFGPTAGKVADTLVALKLLSGSHGYDATDLTVIARGLDAIDRAGQGEDPIGLRPLALQDVGVTPSEAEPEPEPAPDPIPAPSDEEAEKLLARLDRAIETLTAVKAADFEAPESDGARLLRRPPEEAPDPQGRQSLFSQLPRAWMVSAEAVSHWPQEVRNTLTEVDADPGSHPLPAMLDALHAERSVVIEKVDPSRQYTDPDLVAAFVGPPRSPMPTGHGTIQPIGIGDLLLVRQHIKSYEGGEVGHIENVLASETLSRDTRRLERTETTFTQESETTKEEERDTQSTERFSLKRETSSTVKLDAELKTGLSVDAKYGPFVQIKANAEVAVKASKEESAKQASEYSKDVVARSLSRVVDRVREQRTLMTLTEFEERYSHGFENAGGPNISGVYQWVDQVLEAQIYNYGTRLLFDVTLPEPATAVMLQQAGNKPMPQGIKEPPEFTIDASQITETNYTSWAQLYDAVGLTPPPPPVKTFNKQVASVQTENPYEIAGTDSIAIEDGYEAQYALLQHNAIPNGPWVFVVIIGNAFVNGAFGVAPLDMNFETGALPLAWDFYGIESFAMTIEVFCRRTESAMDAWRLKTHATIMQAYVAKLAAYRQALTEAQAAAATAAYGRSPGLNAELINDELHKQCVALVTGQQFEAFGALETSPDGFAQPNLVRTSQQMPYVRFFEQAFEWERITYALYPYFWGWKPAWGKRMLLDDTDPVFAAFLRAGAARVVFPVRPGFESAVLHFLETGEIWEGGPPPDVNSPLYVPIVKEIQAAQGAPGDEVAEGDPWPVRLPTTLVKLRPNDDLPTWQKVNGQWVPDN